MRESKLVSIVLVISILFTIFPYLVSAATPHYNTSSWAEYPTQEQYNSIVDELPSINITNPSVKVPIKLANGLKLNYRIWKDKHIVVYGNYSSVGDKNQFKCGTQIAHENVNSSDGYYHGTDKEGSTGYGEYRYHGFDVSGNLYSNINFINDANGSSVNARNFIKRPWDNLPPQYRQSESPYNQYAENSPDDYTKFKLKQWIARTFSSNGNMVPLKDRADDPDVYLYLNILSGPSCVWPGEGRIWHEGNNDKIWYQTMSVPMLTNQDNLPVSLTATCLNSQSDFELTDKDTDTDNRSIAIKVKLNAVLEDIKDGIELFNDPVEATKYYTRRDLTTWDFTLDTTQGVLPANVQKVDNLGANTFQFNVTQGYIKNKCNILNLVGTTQPNYRDGKKGNKKSINLAINFTTNMVEVSNVVVAEFDPLPDIPEVAFDGEPFSAADYTDMSMVTDRRVYVDGMPVDDNVFFSGNFVFPGSVGMNGRLAVVNVEYDVKDIQLPLGDKLMTTDIVYIYPTKPNAAFKITPASWKQNRKITVQEMCNASNISIVTNKYPIAEYRWTFGGDTSQIRYGSCNDVTKEFLYKEPGIYSITLECRNTLGKWSDPYTISFEILPDIGPAIELNLCDSVVVRNDTVSSWLYNVCSTDGDKVSTASIELWYDSNNDGTVDQKLNTCDGKGEFPIYTPTKLGYYKYILIAKDEFGEATIPTYVTDADKKTSKREIEFWVDNYRPMSDIYIEFPIVRPNIDVFFMLDKDLDTTKRDYIINSRMNMANYLIGKNIIPNVRIWDMHTYTYEQDASTSVHTGSGYPAAATTYSSNGYSGTLNRTSVSDNGAYHDHGSWQSSTESRYFSGSWSNTLYTYWDCNGKITSQGQTNPAPGSLSIDSDGFSGSIPRTGQSPSPTSCGYCTAHKGIHKISDVTTWTAYYGGTLTKTVSVWVPKMQWDSDYTGYYSGKIYKNVRQPYTDPFTGTTTKYVVYISDSTISELPDLNMVLGEADTKLILAGDEGIKSQKAHTAYIDCSGSIDSVINQTLENICTESPAVEKYYVLPNQNVPLTFGNIDLDNDPIIETSMQYVHDGTYFDNPTGQETATQTSYSDTSGWTSIIKGSFTNVGKYEIYRRIKDNPSTDPNFSQYAYYSGATKVEIYVHRKPIALCTLDWDFDTATNLYKTTWVDKSYDLDHQYSRPDKGIVDRKIMYRPQGGAWIYSIPDNLTPGTSYELQYYVKDSEGVWSDPFIMNYAAGNIPAVQLKADLRALDGNFSIGSIPASEWLEYFNVWTRYPTGISLEAGRVTGSLIEAATRRTVVLSAATGTKSGNDIAWNNINYQIPPTLSDGSYTYRLEAIAANGQKKALDFPVTVFTPINLYPGMPAQLVTSCNAQIFASTSKYANTTQVTLFQGTTYQVTRVMTGAVAGNTKQWSLNYAVPAGIPSGNYNAEFRSTTLNGKTETRTVQFTVESLKITAVTIEGLWNHWRGQTDLFGKQLTNEPHRFLGLETIKVSISVQGMADKVVIRLSPELEAMQYTNSQGHTYDYKNDFFGHYVNFPGDSTILISNPQNQSLVNWEYSLPLAPSTKNWEDERERPSYKLTITAYKGGTTAVYEINDLELTGDIYDLTYIEPVN